MIAAWSVELLGRSLRDLIGFLDVIRTAGVDLYLHQQGLDTSTPTSRTMFQMCGIFAEFERAMIVERVRAGMMGHGRKGSIWDDHHRLQPPLASRSAARLRRASAAGRSHATCG